LQVKKRHTAEVHGLLVVRYQTIALIHCIFQYKKQPCINCIYTTLQCNLVLGLTCYGLAARLVVAAIIAILVITVKSTNSQIFSAQKYAIDKRPDHNLLLQKLTLSYFCETNMVLPPSMDECRIWWGKPEHARCI